MSHERQPNNQEAVHLYLVGAQHNLVDNRGKGVSVFGWVAAWVTMFANQDFRRRILRRVPNRSLSLVPQLSQDLLLAYPREVR